VQKAVAALHDVSELSICVRHILRPSQYEALQEFLCFFEFSFLFLFFFLFCFLLRKYFNYLGDMLFLLYIIVMDRISAYRYRILERQGELPDFITLAPGIFLFKLILRKITISSVSSES